MQAIRFESVSRTFRRARPQFVKEALLGAKRQRRRSAFTHAVQDLSFSITAGESVALLGHNGSGKSTTLKMLARVLRPTQGRILSRGRIAPLLQLGSGFHPDLTGRENIFLNAAILGVSRRFIQHHMDEIIEFAGLGDSIDMPVRFFSTGMHARLGFAIAVNVDPEIVLIDEVLSVGDEEFQQRGLSRMRSLQQEGRTMILVTHSLEAARSFCDRALVLSHGRCTFDGPMASASDAYESSRRSEIASSASMMTDRTPGQGDALATDGTGGTE